MSESILQGGKGEEADPGKLMGDDKSLRSDLIMIKRAIREGWDVPLSTKKKALERLLSVVEKATCEVMTIIGPAHLDGPADGNAVRAASVLVQMMGQDQEDFWNNDKNERLDAGKTTENVQFSAGVVHRLPLPESLADGK